MVRSIITEAITIRRLPQQISAEVVAEGVTREVTITSMGRGTTTIKMPMDSGNDPPLATDSTFNRPVEPTMMPREA